MELLYIGHLLLEWIRERKRSCWCHLLRILKTIGLKDISGKKRIARKTMLRIDFKIKKQMKMRGKHYLKCLWIYHQEIR